MVLRYVLSVYARLSCSSNIPTPIGYSRKLIDFDVLAMVLVIEDEGRKMQVGSAREVGAETRVETH